jgi:two-component sensor histidine kinase
MRLHNLLPVGGDPEVGLTIEHAEQAVPGPDPEAAPLPALDFRAVFDCSPRPLLLMAADPPRFTMVAVNQAHARAFASKPERLIGWGVLEVFGPNPSPEVAPFVEAIRTSLERVVETGRTDQMSRRPYPWRAPDGTVHERYTSATNTPVFDAEGRLTHILSATQDVTGEVMERRSEEARSLLMREVDHRARNALTVVQMLVRLTKAKTIDEFRRILDGRVAVMGRVQASLAARRWEGASLREVVEAELAGLASSDHYAIEGRDLLLAAQDVQAISMAIHELATNAVKHGAFSAPGGRVEVRWKRRRGVLDLDWIETSPNPVGEPTERGFGSQLITQLTRQMQGTAAYEWRPEGVRIRLRLKTAPLVA